MRLFAAVAVAGLVAVAVWLLLSTTSTQRQTHIQPPEQPRRETSKSNLEDLLAMLRSRPSEAVAEAERFLKVASTDERAALARRLPPKPAFLPLYQRLLQDKSVSVRLVALQRVVKLPPLHAAFLVCHTAPKSETEKQTLRLCLARVSQKSPNDLPKEVDGATLQRVWRDVVLRNVRNVTALRSVDNRRLQFAVADVLWRQGRGRLQAEAARMIATLQPDKLQKFVTAVCRQKHLGERKIKAAFAALNALQVSMDRQVFQKWLWGLKATHPALRNKIAALLRRQGR